MVLLEVLHLMELMLTSDLDDECNEQLLKETVSQISLKVWIPSCEVIWDATSCCRILIIKAYLHASFWLVINYIFYECLKNTKRNGTIM
jgi:hypothetical protein